ncbi:hypothetical protein AZK46_15705 [Acinetobacter baumannii]|uniref:hypothetical protein n=1 Tax=Acinetobacter baumannii TaxID=470 RepID=UPI0007D862DC|nr:hypothetical protein [Acinetobacter baumannii]OAM07564.1 hypothetical protein AZK46_15705 [Acinetobacter baumannii]
MKPEQFIRDFGEKKAREVVEGIPSKYMECYYSTLCYCTKAKKYSDRFNPRIELVNMADLKRLVESADLLKYLGGYERTKARLQMARKNGTTFGIDHLRWQQACRDHESIYGGGQ